MAALPSSSNILCCCKQRNLCLSYADNEDDNIPWKDSIRSTACNCISEALVWACALERIHKECNLMRGLVLH